MGKKSILIRLEQSEYDNINNLMCHTLVSDGIVIDKMHFGQKQDFYKRLLTIGINVLKQEWDDKEKKFESQNSD